MPTFPSNKNMLFNLEEIREAVNWAIGDDGLRSKEVVELLKQMKKEDSDAAKKNNK